MSPKKQYRIFYAPQVKTHLRAIEKKYHSLIRETIEIQLAYGPNIETRNKKPLKPPVDISGEWEIRFGPNNRFRVFYGIDEANYQVNILAIGFKSGNQLFIGKEEIIL